MAQKEPFSIFFSPNRKKLLGFTIVELMIVVSIIALLAVISAPGLVRARVQSNESATTSNLRTISSATEAYRTTLQPPTYPAAFNILLTSNPPYLDSSWTGLQRQGYAYTYAVAGDASTYSIGAVPQLANITGISSFCVDQTGIIRRYGAGGQVNNAAGCDAAGVPI